MTATIRDIRDGHRKRHTVKRPTDHRLGDVALHAARAKFLRALHQCEAIRLELAGAARVLQRWDVDAEQAMTAHLCTTLLD